MQAPEGWKSVKFKDLFDIKGGSQPPKSDFSDILKPGYIRLLQIRDYSNDKHAVYIEDSGRWPKCLKFDIMIGRYGASVGRILTGKEGAYNVALVKVLFNRMELDSSWVRLFFESNNFQEPIQLLSRSAQNGFNKSDLSTISIYLPPAAEQKRIASKVEALQQRTRRARQALDTIPPLIEKFRQSVLASAFRGDLTADWREQNPDVEPASVLLERIREERRRRWEEAELEKMRAKGKVPSDEGWKARYKEPYSVVDDDNSHPDTWTWVTLEGLSWSSDYGTSVKCSTEAEHGVPVLRIPNVAEGSISLDNLKYAPRTSVSNRDLVRPNDFLIVRTNGSRSLIGRSALYEHVDGQAMSFASYLIRYRLLSDLVLGRWVSFAWRSQPIRRCLLKIAATSAGQYNVSLSKLSPILIPLPPYEEMVEINRRVTGLLRGSSVVDSILGTSVDQLGKLDQSILAKAFRGDLVPQDPTDEPAAVLLERIRAEKASQEPKRKGRRSPPAKASRPPPSPAKVETSKENDKPSRTAKDFTPDNWHHALLESIGDEPAEREDVIEAAATWAAENMGLRFQRLRRDGVIVKGLKNALRRAIRRGEVEKIGLREVRRVL